MSDSNPADIPATLKFQEEVKIYQEEYKTALKKGVHPDENFNKAIHLNALFYDSKCQKFYEDKVNELSSRIIEENKKSNMSHIDLLNYPRFKDLVFNAIYKTHDFLESN